MIPNIKVENIMPENKNKIKQRIEINLINDSILTYINERVFTNSEHDFTSLVCLPNNTLMRVIQC